MLDKVFDPRSFEGNFSFEVEASLRNPNAEPYMVLLPPPNVTGSLHIGHALCYTLQDVLARYKRMRGYDVLFQPGLDHAGIVTQLLVEKQLYESGIEKGTLTKDKLLKEIWYWKEQSGCTILDQLKILGISCDFSRLRFTLDEDSKRAVTKLFVKLFRDGLLRRGERMVSWDPVICTAVSDLEIIEKEVDGHMWHIKYMLEDKSDFIPVATTRPETIFGDAAVAVNPNDQRYRKFIGKNVRVPLTDRVIPVIADKHADMDKGTGAVKITPAHDFNDYEVGRRHKLPVIDIMDEHAILNDNVPELFRKLERFEARKKVVEFLQKTELLIKEEKIKHLLPFGDRSNSILEPRITKQWFVHAEKLAQPAIRAVEEGKLQFVPTHWQNLYFEWLRNIRPWCISRQIWWGHRIPAWYGPDGQVFVAEKYEDALKQAVVFYGKNQVELVQDDDVLDTWFSSGMWPYITLGWPDDTDELRRYYSKMVVVTGFDIIFFWVARMVMMGIYAMDNVPFPEVYIHGLVRDAKGHKMSKSRGNVIDPLKLCEKYGTDAVRYTLTTLASPGRDLKIDEQSVEINRNFLTKLWNVVRFAQMNGCVYNNYFDPSAVDNAFSKWIIVKVLQTVKEVEVALDSYRFDEATKAIYHCIWSTFCDWYLEFIKPVLQQSAIDEERAEGYNLNYTIYKKDVRDTTAWAIVQFVRLLYPIAPFISKKLSGEMGVMEMSWPSLTTVTPDERLAVEHVEFLQELITSVRSLKQCLHLPASEKVYVSLNDMEEHYQKFLQDHATILRHMAHIELGTTEGMSFPIAINSTVVQMFLMTQVDVKSKIEQLRQELTNLEKAKNSATARLANEEFLSKAAAEVVEEHKKRVVSLDAKIQKMSTLLRNLEMA